MLQMCKCFVLYASHMGEWAKNFITKFIQYDEFNTITLILQHHKLDAKNIKH